MQAVLKRPFCLFKYSYCSTNNPYIHVAFLIFFPLESSIRKTALVFHGQFSYNLAQSLRFQEHYLLSAATFSWNSSSSKSWLR